MIDTSECPNSFDIIFISTFFANSCVAKVWRKACMPMCSIPARSNILSCALLRLRGLIGFPFAFDNTYGQFIQTNYDYPCIITEINKSDRCICFIFAEVSILYFYSANKFVTGSSPAPLFQRPVANHLKYTESCLHPYKIQQIPEL